MNRLYALCFFLLAGNVVGSGDLGNLGLVCSSGNDRAKDNIVGGFAILIQNYGDVGGNDLTP